MAYDAADATVVMFGGFDRAGRSLDDTWTWGGSTWTQQHPATSPPARANAVLAYDPQSGHVLLFGGVASPFAKGCSGCSTLLQPTTSDTWSWDGSSWTRVAKADTPYLPGATYMATDPASGRVVLVSLSPTSDTCPASCTSSVSTWTWAGAWRQIATPPPPELGQIGVALVVDPVTRKLAIISVVPNTSTCVTWSENGPTSTPPSPIPVPSRPPKSPLPATPAAVPSSQPKPACTPATAPKLLLSDWDGESWAAARDISGDPALPPLGVAVYDPAQTALVIVGVSLTSADTGEAGAITPTTATWTWRGSWTEHHASASPDAIEAQSVTFDQKTGELVLFGGLALKNAATTADNLPVVDTTWTWDGSRWTLRGGSRPHALPPSLIPIPSASSSTTVRGGGSSGGECEQSWDAQPEASGALELTLTVKGSPQRCSTQFMVVDAQGSPVKIEDGVVTTVVTVHVTWSNWCMGTAPLFMKAIDAANRVKGGSQWLVSPPPCTDASKPSRWSKPTY